MKKALTITLLVALVLTLACTVVNANTKREDLVKYLVDKAKDYGYTDVEAEIERALPAEIDDAQYTEVVNQVKNAEAVIGDTDPAELTATQREQVLSYANAAAKEVGLKVVTDSKNKTVDVVNISTGKSVISRTYEDGKLVQTGSDNLVFVVLSLMRSL